MAGGVQSSKRARKLRRQLVFAKSQGGWGRAVPATSGGGCPTPSKRRWDSQEAAQREAKAGRVAYRCRCRSWHLTTKGAGS